MIRIVSLNEIKITLFLEINLDVYMKKRLELIQKNQQEHFSSDIELHRIEINAENKLLKIRDEMFEKDPSLVTGFFYDKLETLKKSKLFEALYEMPKPAVHHVHLTASAPLDFLIKLTYYDHVWFNDREQLFKVSKKGIKLDGYQKMSSVRKYWSKA